MLRRGLVSLFLSLILAVTPALSAAAEPSVTDPDVQKGVQQVDEGDYDAAIFTLDAAARRLAGDPKRVADLSQAYLYLGIAYMGKGHQAAAHAKFREAVQQIRDISLSPDRFPPKVIDALEAARAEVRTTAATTASATTAPATPPGKKGGGGKALLILGGVAAVGGGVAVAAGGGGGDSGGASTPADNRRVQTFGGTLCGDYETCPDSAYRNVDIVVTNPGTLEATVTWGNPSIFFFIELKTENYDLVATSNRTTNTQSQVSSAVTPRTSSPSAAYILTVGRGDGNPVTDNFTLTVRHP
jgi:tetratricopeptide (TPR) repeat protein